MISGFGNNTVSALASDITATQTTFYVIPGAGEKFEQLLTTGNVNAGSPHSVYAKLTLTDSQGTVFEICHLTKVAGDSLTVIRGQEGTTPKGWSLNDVVANFATRGSEESFVQIEQLQGGDFTSATAGGTPNALTIALPSTYMNNASNDWALNTPLMIMPIAANTGAVTIQVTLAGKVVGTFPAYKGNKAQLEKGDILSGIPFICAMDNTKAYFTIVNPVNIYGALLRANNLSDLSDVAKAKENLELDKVGNYAAVPTTGGDVGYLKNATFYSTSPDSWEGAGGFASQYATPSAPFFIPYGYAAPQDVSSYAPIIKGSIYTEAHGYGTAVSFGALTSGGDKFASAVIHVIGDDGTAQAWLFDPLDGSFGCPGPVNAGSLNTGNINSSLGIYEQGQRVYSPNNPQPAPDLSPYIRGDACHQAGFVSQDINNPYMMYDGGTIVGIAPRDWVSQNFLTSVRQASATWSGAVGGGLQVPAGCVVIGARNNGSSDVAHMGLLYAAEQVCVNGNWVTIGLA